MNSAEWTLSRENATFQRPFGESEAAFFPASKEGLGDM